jgi:AraC-like DNA-binding protein
MERNIQIGNLSLIRPVVNFANFTTVPAGTSWGPRIIPDCQFIHVVSGSAEVILNGAARSIVSGDTVFYGMDTPHQIVVSQDHPFTFYSIHFSWDRELADPIPPYSELRDCSPQDLERRGPTYSITIDSNVTVTMPHYFNIAKIENLMAPIVREYMMAELGYIFMMRGQLYLLLTEVLRGLISNRTIGSEQGKKIASVLEVMRQEPVRSWTIPQLARIGGYHPTYFAALFKEAVGHAPKHFLILERIRLAKTLLLELDSIEAAADRLGYSSVHYFSRHFKEVTGFTPSEYKKRSAFL